MKKPHGDHTVPQKVHYQTYWERNQEAVYWIKLSRAQDQGLQFWQSKTFAIITCATVPGDCIDRVILNSSGSQQRPAPKFTLKSNWLTQQKQQQQPQQPILEEGINSIWKQHATWESKAGGQRHGSDPGNWCKPLLRRTLILISMKKKLSRMRSQTMKRTLKRSNESKLVRTIFVFKKTSK